MISRDGVPPGHRTAAAAALAALALLLTPLFGAARTPSAVEAERVDELVARRDAEGLAALAPEVLPALARRYRDAGTAGRVELARLFYRMGVPSAEIKAALMEDVHTEDVNLRLQVQWALGRVSNEDDVVEVLLDNLEHDANPLFRDKAGCALAYDQIHLGAEQKARLYERLIELLESSDGMSRSLAIRVLYEHTGQHKGYHPARPPEERAAAVARWRGWLEEYRSQL